MHGVTDRLNPPSRLYWNAALALAVLVLAGFARSYYLRALLPARHLTPLAHVHGILMTGWIVLFATQALLISKRRVAVHRWLGTAGAALAAVILIVGSLTVAAAIHRRFPGISPARFARIFVEFDGLSLWVFGALPGSDWDFVVAAATTSAFALTCALVDALRLGRLHPAMAWGTACVLAANLLTRLAQAAGD